jgi:16S rRNA (guanine527-N7)-methyltransferase
VFAAAREFCRFEPALARQRTIDPAMNEAFAVALQERLAAGLTALGLAIDSRTQELLLEYLALLAKWNRAYNLTAVRDPHAMVSRHLLDSLAILPWVGHGPLLDLGSGAGLPGIPLAIARPGLRITMLDANAKKARFLRQAVAELGLRGVEVVQGRAEAFQPAQPYLTIVSRAFAALPEMVACSRHLLAQGGSWLAMKGRVPREEIAQLGLAYRTEIHPLEVPQEPGERHLLVIRVAPVEG